MAFGSGSRSRFDTHTGPFLCARACRKVPNAAIPMLGLRALKHPLHLPNPKLGAYFVSTKDAQIAPVAPEPIGQIGGYGQVS
jgi:hypothetical protein